jgi:16S rRNA G1207 methylase RsmC
MDVFDTYFKKQLSYHWREHTFTFDVAHTIFSSHEIDKGTDLLLRTLDPPADLVGNESARILDLGCGCGILGVVLARHYPAADVVLADKDLLAVRYARHNAHLNGVTNVEVVGSVGIEAVPPAPYDLIVSNIPAKIGDTAIEEEFLLAPLRLLRQGGVFWFVAVSGLNHLIPKIGVRHNLKLKQAKKRSGYTVYRLEHRE